MLNTILVGDVLDRIREIPDGSVHCCVTSPPYWGVRDYENSAQIGQEPRVEEFLDRLVRVFREVRRTLRDDGTLWLNVGDSYAKTDVPPLKCKDLLGLPWLVALALRGDGWYLRTEIIWRKPNAMPESVEDRPQREHEYVFLLAKQPRYYYDRFAVWVPRDPLAEVADPSRHGPGRNRRSVWDIRLKPFRNAHFATFPPELPRLCILAGTSHKGACAQCGSPWVRQVENPDYSEAPKRRESRLIGQMDPNRLAFSGQDWQDWRDANPSRTIGWEASCKCDAGVVPCVVLDPFAGAGTTLMVARSLLRSYIGIELNPYYADIAEKRLVDVNAMAEQREAFNEVQDLLPS